MFSTSTASRRRVVVATAAATLLWLFALSLPIDAAPRARPWFARGRIEVPSMAEVTAAEWNATCPRIPVSQGVSSFVVEIPRRFSTGTAIVDVKLTPRVATPLIGGFGRHTMFFDGNCGMAGEGEDPLASVPEGTRFIMVSDYFQAQLEVELKLFVDPTHPMHDANS